MLAADLQSDSNSDSDSDSEMSTDVSTPDLSHRPIFPQPTAPSLRQPDLQKLHKIETDIHPSFIPLIVGKHGMTITSFERHSGASIDIPPRQRGPESVQDKIGLRGTLEQCRTAENMILARISGMMVREALRVTMCCLGMFVTGPISQQDLERSQAEFASKYNLN